MFLSRFQCFSKSIQVIRNQSTSSILNLSPDKFKETLQNTGRRRMFMVYDHEKKLPNLSDNSLAEISTYFKNNFNYREHEGVFVEIGKRSGALMSSFIWKTNRGQASGGIRMWKYDNMKSYFEDGLRLSTGMGHKSSLAGLWAGGGKGLIHMPEDHKNPKIRENVFLDFGDFLTSLRGCYIGAEDVGLTVEDLNLIFKRTRFVTCISPELGGSGNPSEATGRGVISAMEAALEFRQMGNLEGKKIVLQGCGNVASFIIDGLLKKNVGSIIASDCNEDTIQRCTERYANAKNVELRKTEMGDLSILYEPCDILSPCALGAILSQETIPHIQASIICGAANNQLATPLDNIEIEKRGMTYVVDFVANRMGIVNCANEVYGSIPNDPYFEQHLGRDWENSIYKVVLEILSKSREQGITASEAAAKMADKLSVENHPVWGHRSLTIVKNLVDSDWVNQ